MLRDLYRAISAFFDKANPAGRPRFKARKAGYATARWTRNGFKVSGSGLGVCPVAPTGRATGLDVGLSTFATTEDPATDVPNPRFARSAARALARSQRSLARKTKGSNHRAKAGLNRSIADAGWAQLRATLAWQAAKAGKTVVSLPARETTQTCSGCGAKAKPRIELSDRVYSCQDCGLVVGRDRNAARNLNPDRPGPGGGTEPSGTVPAGDDGNKTEDPKDVLAA